MDLKPGCLTLNVLPFCHLPPTAADVLKLIFPNDWSPLITSLPWNWMGHAVIHEFLNAFLLVLRFMQFHTVTFFLPPPPLFCKVATWWVGARSFLKIKKSQTDAKADRIVKWLTKHRSLRFNNFQDFTSLGSSKLFGLFLFLFDEVSKTNLNLKSLYLPRFIKKYGRFPLSHLTKFTLLPVPS